MRDVERPRAHRGGRLGDPSSVDDVGLLATGRELVTEGLRDTIRSVKVKSLFTRGIRHVQRREIPGSPPGLEPP